MTDTENPVVLIGTSVSDTLLGTNEADAILGLAGNDTISGGGGADNIVGDFSGENLLAVPESALSLEDLAFGADWNIRTLTDGHISASQNVETSEGSTYSFSLDVAANLAASASTGGIVVFWNGQELARFDTIGAEFQSHEVTVMGSGGVDELTLESTTGDAAGTSKLLFDLPVTSYERTVEINGEALDVRSFAAGQPNFYQVMESTLHAFDPSDGSYTEIGGAAGHVYNGMGFNIEDDLLYAIATGNGVDSRGAAVAKSDLVMIDATGSTYRVGDAPYSSWVGDFDSEGNLWTFDSDMDHIAKIDVSAMAANTGDAVDVFKFPKDLVTEKVLDVAYDAATQRFMGVARPPFPGAVGTVLVVDVSGEEPTFSTIEITHTIVDGETLTGIPRMTFGAAFLDVDGNLYVGGNSGDHDMNGATAKSGGIYKVVVSADTGQSHLELVSDAQNVRNNDGAADPRALAGTIEIETEAEVLIRKPTLVETSTPDVTYDDALTGNAGTDTLSGGLGDDQVVGGSRGDIIDGGVAHDQLFGGAGPNSESSTISSYDDEGRRFNQFGDLLAEDDDVLRGGDGDDYLHGSAGHDWLSGGEGADELIGGSGSDVLYGGADDDHLSGGSQDDQVFGGDGDDRADGGSGDDELIGGTGSDDLRGGSGNDALYGGSGQDDLSGGSGDDTLAGDDGDDQIRAGSGDDHLTGGFGDDVLAGGSGNDKIAGEDGRDRLDGGSGSDVLSGGQDRDRLKGGSGADELSGGDGRDYLAGGSGEDRLDGGSDADFLRGGSGGDMLTGGSGSDTFAFRLADMDGSTDQIADLVRHDGESDRIDLSDLDLLAVGQTVEDWTSENLSKREDGAFVLNLGDGALVVSSFEHADDDLKDAILDALVF